MTGQVTRLQPLQQPPIWDSGPSPAAAAGPTCSSFQYWHWAGPGLLTQVAKQGELCSRAIPAARKGRWHKRQGIDSNHLQSHLEEGRWADPSRQFTWRAMGSWERTGWGGGVLCRGGGRRGQEQQPTDHAPVSGDKGPSRTQ